MKLDQSRGPEPVFLVRFHGVRGSFPVPSPGVLHFGGNTSCIEINSGPYRVVVDCGTGMIGLGKELAESGSTAPVLVLVSHVHHDHTMGWPFFRPVYDPRATLFLLGPGSEGRSFREVFEGAFANPYFPVPADKMASRREFMTLGHLDAVAWSDPAQPPAPLAGDAGDALVVRSVRNLNHPNGGVLNFRLERGGRTIVIATDVEGSSCETGDLADHARGADLLIHDAQYTEEQYPRLTRGWGHSTWAMAADVAERAGARRLVLYHHDPAHDDTAVEAIERLTRARFPRTVSACEGLEIRL